MIPRAYRLSTCDLKHFSGHKHYYPWGIVITAPAPSPQWSVSISKRALPNATHRNRLRRQLMHFLYQHRHQLDPHTAFRILINRSENFNHIQPQLCSLLFTKP